MESESKTAYLSDTDRVVSLLNAAASRGFLAEEEPTFYGGLSQRVRFTAEEKSAVRKFMAMYTPVLAQIDYPMASFFGESEGQRTCSLLGMLGAMLRDSGDNPEYVAANANRLRTALITHAEAFKGLEFDREMRGEALHGND